MLLNPNARAANGRLRFGVRLRLVVDQRRELFDRLVHGHIVRQHTLANGELQLMLEAALRHHRGRHTVVHILLGVLLRIGTNAAVAAHHQIPLDRLHQCQRIDFHGAALPLSQIRTLRMPLQIALELVRVEELQRTLIGATARPGRKVVHLHRELFQLRHATVQLRDERTERGRLQHRNRTGEARVQRNAGERVQKGAQPIVALHEAAIGVRIGHEAQHRLDQTGVIDLER